MVSKLTPDEILIEMHLCSVGLTTNVGYFDQFHSKIFQGGGLWASKMKRIAKHCLRTQKNKQFGISNRFGVTSKSCFLFWLNLASFILLSAQKKFSNNAEKQQSEKNLRCRTKKVILTLLKTLLWISLKKLSYI